MATTDNIDLLVNLAANTEKFKRDILEAAKNTSLDFDTKPLLKRFSQNQSVLKKQLTQTMAEAATSGMKKANLEGLASKLLKHQNKFQTQNAKVLKASLNAHKKNATEYEKTVYATEKTKLSELEKRIKKELKFERDLLDLRQRQEKRLERGRIKHALEVGGKIGEGLASAVNKLKGGDLSGLLSGAGGGAGGLGGRLTQGAKDRNLQGRGKGLSKMMGQMGGFLSKLGPVLVAVGALAGGLSAVIGVVAAADGAMKTLNRTLLDSGTAAVDLNGHYGGFEDTLNRVRGTFSNAFNFNRIWGTTAKDHLEILGAYSEAGVVFNEMTRGVKNASEEMDRLQQYTSTALTYSKLLGVSSQEMTAHIGSHMEDLGLTLEGVQSRFSGIIAVAKESGFSTKRFFNMVLQATSGMSMYNVRLEEAAGLLTQLSTILGSKMGGEYLQELAGGFKGEDTQTRTQNVLKMGVGRSLKYSRKDAEMASKAFFRQSDEVGAEKKGLLAGILKKGGLSFDMEPEAFAKALAKLSSKDQGMLQTQMTAVDRGMGKSFGDLYGKSQSFKGGLGNAQAAREFSGPITTMLANLDAAAAVLGKSVHEIDMSDMTQRMAVENMTGKSGEDARKLIEVGKGYQGMSDTIAQAQAKIKGASSDEDKKKAADEFNAMFAKQWGVALSSGGGLYKAMMNGSGGVDPTSFLGDSIENSIAGLAYSSEAKLFGGQDMEKQVSEDIRLAQEIASNTRDLSTIMEQGVEVLLSQIYDVVQHIASFFGRDKMEKSEKSVLQNAQEKLFEEIRKGRGVLGKGQSRMSEIDREMRTASPEQKKKLLAEKAALGSNMSGLTDRLKYQEASMKGIRGIRDAKSLRAYTGGEVLGAGDTDKMISAASNTPEAMKALQSLDKHGALSMAKGNAYSEITKRRQGVWGLHEEAESDVYAHHGDKAKAGILSRLGLGSSVRSLTDNSKNQPSLGGAVQVGGQSLDEFVTDKSLLAQSQRDDRRSDARLKKEEGQREDQTKQINKDAEKRQEQTSVEALAKALSRAKVSGDGSELMRKARLLRSGQTPSGMDANRMVTINGKSTKLGEFISSSSGANADAVKALGAPAKDYMVHVNSQGKVISAQKVSGGDTMYAATMPTGAITQASRRSGRGGGGNVFVSHNYSGEKTQRDLLRKLSRAKLLG